MTVTPWLTEILVFCKLRCSRRVTLPVRGLAQPAPHNPPSPEELPLGDQDTSGRGTSGGEPSSSSSQQQYPPLNDSGEEELDPPQETLVRDTHNFYIVSSDVS